ncbi:leucine-rich repeat-containing protein 71, partial [Eucyclogobius newberryi]|uniref:leucine-rich repeat-containing protein 71 n=1 Tax=Eucyclogobius newberryi TaxID=166745 RepID=UPI003B5C7543
FLSSFIQRGHGGHAVSVIFNLLSCCQFKPRLKARPLVSNRITLCLVCEAGGVLCVQLKRFYLTDNYQCTGNVKVDFPKLCSLLDKKDIPPVYSKTTQVEGEAPEENEPRTTTRWSKPYLHVDLDLNKSIPVLNCKGLRILGLKVDEEIVQVLNKLINHLDGIQSLYFWKAGLTDKMVMSLSNTLSLGCSVRVVHLEGNPLPNHSYMLLLSENSVITHLFLRNNQIGDEGARLIGSALSTTKTANKTLLFLSLAFNRIGDAGAVYLAQGLRYNRALIYLSLANNQIGDSGAAALSKILSDFPLTHEEVVERRKMLAEKMEQVKAGNRKLVIDGFLCQNLSESEEWTSGTKPEAKSNTKKKDLAKREDKTANKDNLKKSAYKPPPAPSKGGKDKKKLSQTDLTEVNKPFKYIFIIMDIVLTVCSFVQEQSSIVLAEPEVEKVNPLLDSLVYCNRGQVFHPGNSTLVYLSLAGNAITEKSLPLFLSSLKQQTFGGLFRLCLNRNHFSPDCELSNKIDQLLQLKDQNDKLVSEVAEEEDKMTRA